MKLNLKNKAVWTSLTILFLVVSFIVTAIFYSQGSAGRKDKAAQIAEAYAVELKRDFRYAANSSKAIEKLVVAKNGKVGNAEFTNAAKLLKKDYISLIELVPNGVVTNTYPYQSKQKKNYDLMQIEEAKQVLNFVKQKNKAVIYGPMPLLNAKRCVVVMNPVTLKSGKFWGYVIMTVKLPDVYQHTLQNLTTMGYDYCIDTNKSPLTQKKTQVESSLGKGEKLKDAVGYTFTYGSCWWTLKIVPKAGWCTGETVLLLIFAVLIDISLSGLLYLFLRTRQQKVELDQLAFKDPLTGLLNRRGFMEELDKRAESRGQQPITLAFIDLDDFKFVNDVYGHVIGDQALKHLAGHLSKKLSADALIGRTGGDEFCIVVAGEPDQTRELIEDAINGVQEFKSGETTVRYTISAGYADFPGQADTAKGLVVLADEALYAAKMHGKHAAKHYEVQMERVKRAQLGFNVKNVAQGMPGGVLIYRADDEEREILFVNDYLVHLLACESYEDFLAYTKSSYNNFVYPADFAEAEKAIKLQLKSRDTDPDKSLFLNYRVKAKNGKILHLSTLGRYVEDGYYGDVFVIFVLPDDLSMKRKK